MNNGNLLNSLLGATGTNSAAAKSTASKSRAETTEKFQQAFEQARPEVAARKPAARKEPDRQDDARPAAAKSDTRPEPANRATDHKTDHKKTAKSEENRDAPVRDPSAKESPLQSRSAQQEKTAGDKVPDEQSTTATDSVNSEDQAADKALQDTAMLDASALVTAEQTLLDSSAAITLPTVIQTSLDQQDELTGTEETVSPLLTELGLGKGDTELTLAEEPGALLAADPAVVATLPVATLPGVETEGDLAAIGVDIKSVGLNSLNPSVPVQATGNQAAVQSGLSLVDDALSGSTSTTEQTDVLATVDSEGGDTSDLTDNPDFVLLNSKAGLNKMAEANLTSLDKAASAITETAKPVAAAVSALESIVRPLESQSPAARAFVVQTGVPVTVGSPQWSQAVGDKVLWLAAQNVSSAEIRLDPPELGPMQVKVSVTQDQASVTFTSHNPVVRDALDQQLNRLREMFAEQGLNLVNVDVSDKSFAQQQRDQDESGKSRSHGDVEEDELMPVAVTSVASVRLVDHYA
ncbi:flagellar hook-length control protein FliK [Cellvibrio sp. pealriver]|uniref:flagellar hook-length control protein FliK n=1 Tax=Cellvibrio sp. pealriver TaxID=1622269 RepID=UPI00066FB8AD|nr:flagellar hook-length control protein FliK [Cellvibrio sp. pealriver]